MAEPKHCDDYIDDETAPLVLRTYLDRARSPAHGHADLSPYPKLFATHLGKRVRVTMASRFGGVGITEDLEKEEGYQKRVAVEELSDFSDSC